MIAMQVIQQIERGKLLECPSRSCPDSVYRVMQECWRRQPQDRITMSQATCRLFQVYCDGIGDAGMSSEAIFRNLSWYFVGCNNRNVMLVM